MTGLVGGDLPLLRRLRSVLRCCLAAGTEAERIELSGWTGAGQPSSGRPAPGDAAAVAATVTEMLSAGLGEEYTVVVDLAREWMR